MIRLVSTRTILLAVVLLVFTGALPASTAPVATPEIVAPEPLWLTPLSACAGECVGPNDIPPVQIACDFQDPPLTAQQCCARAQQIACPAGYTFQGSCYDPAVEISC
jgi:hypothetical protein